MADLEVIFRTHAELEGAQAYAAELERTIGKTKAMGQDTAEMERQFKSLTTALAQSEERLKAVAAAEATTAAEAKKLTDQQRRASNAQSVREETHAYIENARALNQAARATKAVTESSLAAQLAGAALLIVTGGISAGVRKAYHEFSQAEAEVMALDAALAQNGLLIDSVRQKYHELASAMEKGTAIADEEWLRVLTTLTQFGVVPNEIDATAEAVKNLAGFMGGDLASAAQVLGRALHGHTETLSRMGIEIDATKTKSDQLDSIFEQLGQRGGGQLEARANSLKG